MLVKIKTAGLKAGRRLDLKKVADGWSLWDGETLLEESVPVPDTQLGLDHYKCIVNDDKNVRVVRFADIHRHSDNSLKDGILRISDMVKHTEYAGALTDHGNLYGFVEYYNAMNAAGKKPIIGMEAYQENLQGELDRNHLILLAKNDAGYKNLIRLSSESFDHFYHKPHVTWEMLRKYHEGIICTSACLGGLIPKSLERGDRESAVFAAKELLKIFGEDFYIEIQRHGIDIEKQVNAQLLVLAEELHIPVVATTDSHYLRKKDTFAHEVMMCLEQGKTIDQPHRRYEGTGYHLRTSEEMEELFADIPEALDNTLRIADKCNVNVKMGDVNLPNFEIPAPFTSPLEYFKHICKTGFDERFKGKPEHEDPVYLERYDYEMSVIEKMGFETYFLIVWDFINYARSVNVYIGPGRGSAAGSLLAFCMGITDMDPIRFNLLFERFLNPERVSWPD